MPCNARHLLDIMYISLQQILRPFFGCFGGIFLRFWCGIFISLARASIWCIQIFCSSFSSRDTIGNFTYDFFSFFFRFSRKIAENSSFFAKNEKTKKMEAIVLQHTVKIGHKFGLLGMLKLATLTQVALLYFCTTH